MADNLQTIKQRYGIIGNDPGLNCALENAQYRFGYWFGYTNRFSAAFQKLKQKVAENLEIRRLQGIINLQIQQFQESIQYFVGKTVVVSNKKETQIKENEWKVRNSQNAIRFFPKTRIEKIADFLEISIKNCSHATLIGTRKNIKKHYENY